MNTKTISKIIAAVVAALIICASVALPATAADNYSKGTDPAHPAKAAITKVLRMPKGTNPPGFMFQFDFKGIDIDGDATVASTMPAIPKVTVDFAHPNKVTTETKDGDIYVADVSPDFIAGANFSKGPAGVYRYEVTETQGTVTGLDPDKEHITYSQAKYFIDIYVEEENGVFYAKYVNGVIIKSDVDEWYEKDGEDGTKLNPDPDGNGENGGTTIKDDYSEVVFTNRYWKTTGGGPGGDPKVSALSIKKTILGNSVDKDKKFTFEVTVTTPALVVDSAGNPVTNKTYDAYIMNSSGIVKDTRTTGSGYYTLASGVPKSGIELKHDEWLAFVDLEVGAKVSVFEEADSNYRPEYQRNFDGTLKYTASDRNTRWGFPRTPEDAGPHYTKEGDPGFVNLVTFYNTVRSTTPTGLSVDDLPYIVLIGTAVIGLALFLVVKFRRHEKDSDAGAEYERT